jgi:hypothetical protein
MLKVILIAPHFHFKTLFSRKESYNNNHNKRSSIEYLNYLRTESHQNEHLQEIRIRVNDNDAAVWLIAATTATNAQPQ